MDGTEGNRFRDDADMANARMAGYGPRDVGDAYGEEEGGGFNILQILNVLWRGKWTVLLCALIVGSAGYIWVKQETPIYSASAVLLIEGQQEQVIDLQAVVTGVDRSSAGLSTQAEIIKSDQLTDRVVDKLRLDKDPEFNWALRKEEPGVLRSLTRQVLPAIERSIWGAEDPMLAEAAAAEGATESADGEIDYATRVRTRNALKSRIRVAAQPRTYAMVISAESVDPRKAALIANAVADQYILDQLEAKFEGTQRATLWLNDRLGTLKEQLQASERAVADYRAQLADDSGQSLELTEQQLAQLNASLIEARAASAEARARYESIRRLAESGRDVTSSAQVLGASSVQAARSKLSDLRRQEAELATRYGPKHPRMINLRAEISDVQRTIGGEVGKVVESVKNELEVAEAREKSLQESVDALQGRSFQQGKGVVRLRELEREAEANRLIYESFLNRFKETSEQQGLQQTDSRVIAHAEPPGAPARPNVNRAVMMASILGGGLGVALIFFLESINHTFRSKDEFEAATGVPVLASIPQLNLKKRMDIFSYVRSKPNSSYTESVRDLRTSLLLANVDQPPKVILVTSSVPAEGKSSLALSLAAVSAGMGKRTLLVECDLRRPTVKEIFPVRKTGDVVDVVSGAASLNDAILQDDEQEHLFALPGAEAAANPGDILASHRFHDLITSLSESFDMVVLDSPPVLAVTDARILARIADITVVASRWDETPRDLVIDAIRQLRHANARIAGAAFTRVDGKKMAGYRSGYGHYGSHYKNYYGGYSTYYSN